MVVFAANSHGYACVSFSYLLQPQEALGDDLDQITWSLIMALGVCYQARLQNRDEYQQEVAKVFNTPCRLPGGPDRIQEEITRLVFYLEAQTDFIFIVAVFVTTW